MKPKTIQYILFIILALFVSACSPQVIVDDFKNMPAPDFTLDNTLGGQTSLSDFSGQPVLLFFHMAVG